MVVVGLVYAVKVLIDGIATPVFCENVASSWALLRQLTAALTCLLSGADERL